MFSERWGGDDIATTVGMAGEGGGDGGLHWFLKWWWWWWCFSMVLFYVENEKIFRVDFKEINYNL